MGRVYIDTDELGTLASQFRSDAGELGDLNLDLVRAWAHTLPPPVQLLSIGAHAGWIQAQLVSLAADIVGDSAMLDLEIAEMLAEQGASDVIGALGQFVTRVETTWTNFITKVEQEVATAVNTELMSLRKSISGLVAFGMYITENPMDVAHQLSLAASEILRGYNLRPNFKLAVGIIRLVPFVSGGMDLLVCQYDMNKVQFSDIPHMLQDTIRYGSQSGAVRKDMAVIAHDSQDAASKALDGGVSIGLDLTGVGETKTLIMVGTHVLTGTNLGLVLADRFKPADYSRWLSPSYDIKALYHWQFPDGFTPRAP